MWRDRVKKHYEICKRIEGKRFYFRKGETVEIIRIISVENKGGITVLEKTFLHGQKIREKKVIRGYMYGAFIFVARRPF